MSWKRHFDFVPVHKRLEKALKNQNNLNSRDGDAIGSFSNRYANHLATYYEGHPLRIQRYQQYHEMDNDPVIYSALDTIADFCTKTEEKTDELFQIIYHGDTSDTEVEILKTSLKQWTRLNEFKRRLWRMFRNTIKYGDQFFIRDPETLEWIGVSAEQVEKVVVNPGEGKKPVYYIIKDLDLHLQELTASQPDEYGNDVMGAGSAGLKRTKGTKQTTFGTPTQNSYAVSATHVVHLSLSEGLDANWPFGTSVLESVFKVYRQKELLADAIIIYRIVRAPERRVFYVDVGNQPPHKAQAHLERMKNEMAQRRFPTRNGGSGNFMDAAYNPMSIQEDLFFAQTAEGRGSKVETLPGGENLGQIDDLKYWYNLIIRGLQVPTSYLPNGPDDGNASYTDGRVGTAYLQEYRFARYCQRLQMLMINIFDKEFKLFIKQRGLNMDSSLYELRFNPPMDFRIYEQIELDSAQANVFNLLKEEKYLSRRFILRRFLNLNEDELLENERLWREENVKSISSKARMGSAGAGGGGGAPGLESLGIRPDMGDDLGDDMGDGMGDEATPGDDLGGDLGSDDMGAAEDTSPVPTDGGMEGKL